MVIVVIILLHVLLFYYMCYYSVTCVISLSGIIIILSVGDVIIPELYYYCSLCLKVK